MVIFWGLLGFAVIVGLFLGKRRAWDRKYWTFFVGWSGSVAAIDSFWFLDWVKFGPSYTALQNAGWLIQKYNLLAGILEQIGINMDFKTAEELLAWFGQEPYKSFLHAAEFGEGLKGFNVLLLARSLDPILTLGLGLALLSNCVAVVLMLVKMIRRDDGGSSTLFGLLSLFSGISLIVLLNHIAFLDSLGSTEDFKVRLLSVLVDARVGSGQWWMLLGLAIIFALGLRDIYTLFIPKSKMNRALEDEW